MKYYMVNLVDSSGIGHTNYTYFHLSDESTIEDAEELYYEAFPYLRYDNPGVLTIKEIDEETYRAGLAFNRYVEVCRQNDIDNKVPIDRQSYHLWETHNMFPTRKWAEMFARKNKPVLIGYPKMHSVNKMDDNGNIHFVYHYSTGIDFRDDSRLRKVITYKWDK